MSYQKGLWLDTELKEILYKQYLLEMENRSYGKLELDGYLWENMGIRRMV